MLLITFFSLLVTIIGYQYLDIPITHFIASHGISQHSILHLFTLIPNGLWPIWLAALGLFFFRWRKYKFDRLNKLFLQFSLAMIIAVYLNIFLKIIFGRTWINTWTHNNLSLLRDGVYGTHFLHGGLAYTSFPSGHTAVTAAAMFAVFYHVKKYRALCLLPIALVGAGLIGMNYHFFSDVIAGGFEGFVIAKVLYLYGLGESESLPLASFASNA